MERITDPLSKLYLGLIPTVGVLWVLDIPQTYFGFAVVGEEAVSTILGIACAAAFLKYPYLKKAGLFEVALGIIAIAVWMWSAVHYEEWIVGMADRTPDKWVPGVIALFLMMEAMRKASGVPITILVWILIVYAFFGHHLPGVFEAEHHTPTKIILYNYADSNGVPGLVLRVVASIVLAFIILGKLMEVSGATLFFTDLAMGWMGHRQGGPAKVAVVASSAFGMVSGSTVGNIMSTGIVTIPLMKRTGFKPKYAAAIEAVASNGGQIAPPVMGATAFLIAEFLEVAYIDVVIAAAIPAALYYLVLFLQVDAIAGRFGLKGIPKEELPTVLNVFIQGWIFLVPIGVLLYFLFWLGFNPALSALYGVGALLVLFIIKKRRMLSKDEWSNFIFGSGENMLPLVMIGGGAGVVIGVLNSTGLGFQLALVLADVGSAAGLLVMLILTAIIAIVLGMGMPTAAVYILLSIVLAPALAKMGVVPMAAHLFLFYFGLLSMLTPPVAVASYVAAGLAGSNMWVTGLVGMQLAAAAYLLPFLWIYNPALLFIGSGQEITLAILSAGVGAWMLARAISDFDGRSILGSLYPATLLAGALAVGSATVWIGTESLWVLAPATAGVAFLLVTKFMGRPANKAASGVS
ncbi:MAG: TRAP transporter fused permease subunit [Proteobacteria bacterium]|nr:TRAP transporter fused permease subunit [Pseudomonadota bacterium]